MFDDSSPKFDASQLGLSYTIRFCIAYKLILLQLVIDETYISSKITTLQNIS